MKPFIGDKALNEVIQNGAKQIIRSIEIEGRPLPTCMEPWPIDYKNKNVGQVTWLPFHLISKPMLHWE